MNEHTRSLLRGLNYPISIEPADEGGYLIQGFPPMEGVISEAETHEEALAMAQDALSGVLAVMLTDKAPIPRPDPAYIPQEPHVYFISPTADITIALLLRWAREDAGLTQAQVAERLGIKQQSYQRLERPDANPSLKTIESAFKAVGRPLRFGT
jgi:antitoxin HicB